MRNEVHIRSYRQEDLEHCRALWVQLVERHRRIYEDPSIGGDDPGGHFDEHLEEVCPGNIWVAVLGDVVAGMAGLAEGPRGHEVEPLVVAEVHRGKGVGRMLVQRVISEARDRGIGSLSVSPVARNREAISFFRECGFATVGHIELFMKLDERKAHLFRPGLDILGEPFDY